jgi:SnoaL-like domain
MRVTSPNVADGSLLSQDFGAIPENRRAVGVGDVAGERRSSPPGFDAFRRRDLDAFLALCDPEVEFISDWLQVEGGGPYRGHDGVRDWWKRLLDAYPDFKQKSTTSRTSATALSRGCCGTAIAR